MFAARSRPAFVIRMRLPQGAGLSMPSDARRERTPRSNVAAHGSKSPDPLACLAASMIPLSSRWLADLARCTGLATRSIASASLGGFGLGVRFGSFRLGGFRLRLFARIRAGNGLDVVREGKAVLGAKLDETREGNGPLRFVRIARRVRKSGELDGKAGGFDLGGGLHGVCSVVAAGPSRR
jgi:hypothetical protein